MKDMQSYQQFSGENIHERKIAPRTQTKGINNQSIILEIHWTNETIKLRDMDDFKD